jgi:predicted nucleic acid-binding protein
VTIPSMLNTTFAFQLGLTLVTNNEREFSRIPNLTIENWTH